MTAVAEAQRHNASRMSVAELERELRRVLAFPERPPVRLAWIDLLRAELAARALSAGSGDE